MDRFRKTKEVVVDVRPSDSWIFAQLLLGKPLPRIVTPQIRETAKLAEMVRLLGNSSRQAEELLGMEAAEPDALCRRELLEWSATISTRAEDELLALRCKESEEREARRRISRLFENPSDRIIEWQEADHPRELKGTTKGGQFAPKGGGGGSGGSPSKPTTSRRIPADEPDRVFNAIRSSSGDHWNGDSVLDVIGAVAPNWLTFVKRHIGLSLASNGSDEPSTTVRSGEFGPPVSGLSKRQKQALGKLTIHFEIPAGWNDIQVAQYILTQLADDLDAHFVAVDWANSKPEALKELADKRFFDGLPVIAELAGGYYKAIAGLLPGGQISVVAWDIQEGDNVGAALGIACMLPLGELIDAAATATGAIALKAGGQVIGVLPVKAIQKIQNLAPDQRALLQKRLLAAKTKKESAEIIEKFLKTEFDRHHPLARFLGGHSDQLLSTIPREVHIEFHKVLREELKAAGFNLPIGGSAGSTIKWVEHLSKDPASQGKAFDAVLKSSRAIDAKHGTEITEKVWKNLVGEKFFILPHSTS